LCITIMYGCISVLSDMLTISSLLI
jgi:hypothetical protein